MTSPRFHFPIASVPAPVGPFVGVPVAGLIPPAQLDVVRQVYQMAWERTQAVLAPTKVDAAYRVNVN